MTGGSRRSPSYLAWERQNILCMELIDEVVSSYKRKKLAATEAVDAVKLLVAFVTSSDDEDTVPSGSRSTIRAEARTTGVSSLDRVDGSSPSRTRRRLGGIEQLQGWLDHIAG